MILGLALPAQRSDYIFNYKLTFIEEVAVLQQQDFIFIFYIRVLAEYDFAPADWPPVFYYKKFYNDLKDGGLQDTS